MSNLEVAGDLFGLISVILTVRASIWCMPTGIVNVLLFAALFFNLRLYADAGLQIAFLVLTIYGWYTWTRTGGVHPVIPTTTLTRVGATRIALLGGLLFVCMALFFARLTDDSLPWIDSLTTALSLLAQYLLSRKVLENWHLWIVADVIQIPLYVYKGVWLTGALYTVFLGLAIAGLLRWRRALCPEPAC